MNALNELGRRRIEAIRLNNRRRISLRGVLIVLLVFVITLICWNTLFLGTSSLLRGSAELEQVNLFSSPNATRISLARESMFVYDGIPMLGYNCEGWSDSDIEAITSPDASTRLYHSKTILVPLMCSNQLDADIGQVLENMDRDPFTAGQTIAWILPVSSPLNETNAIELLNRRGQFNHVIHPLDFLHCEAAESNVVGKSGESQFCLYDKDCSIREFLSFIQTGCIPVVAHNTTLPFQKIISWESAVVRLEPGSELGKSIVSVDEDAIAFKLRVGKTIRNHITSLSRETAFLFSLVYK